MTALAQFRPPQVVAADTELAESLQAGDDAALRELYDRFGGLVFTVALRIVGDRQRAEDVAQQTFLQAWRHAASFEPGRDFAPWLATIARRAAIDVTRREARRPVAPLDDATDTDPALGHHDPDAEDIERVWAVRAAIEQLEPTDRELVRLQHLEGLTHREIAERLGLAIGTVKSRSYRAHKRLAQRLGHLRSASGDGVVDGEDVSLDTTGNRTARDDVESDEGRPSP